MKQPSFSSLRLLMIAVIVAGGCTVKKQEAPPLSGPSEFGLSIDISVSPDVLSQDGGSQSVVTVTARDVSGQPVRNLSLRAEVQVDGIRADFGTLSARNLVTNGDGRSTTVYTAPAAPSVSVDNGTVVVIAVTPVGTNFDNSSSRFASIRLVPPGGVIPPAGLDPYFVFSPTSPADNQTVLFEACNDGARPCAPSTNPVASYSWNFGDGRSASGRTASHAFATPGTYVVRLTITDSYGRTASSSQSITVGAGLNPTAAFVFSPTTPLPNQQVNFVASQSRPAPGRSIASYSWNFGDGTTGSGVQASHSYSVAGTYNVVLVVTDDAGRVGTISQAVTVSTGAPTADFTFSVVGRVVTFNAAASSAVPGRTITSYFWSFGDGENGAGVAPPSKTYGAAGTYTVTLTVTDSGGQSATTSKTVTVQ